MDQNLKQYLDLARIVGTREKRADALRAELEDLKVELSALKPVLDQKVAAILEQCRIPIIIAIREYNARSEVVTKIGEEIDLYVDHEYMVVNVGVTLRNPNGREPYDIMDDDDGDMYADKIRKAVDAELTKLSLPFKLGTIRFPSRYYLRMD